MSSPSMPPPPPTDGGGLRYALVGLALAALAAGGWWLTSSPAAGPAVTPDAGPAVRPPPPPADLVDLVEVEPDAGMPDAGPPEEVEATHHHASHAASDGWECSGELSAEAVARVVRSFDAQIRSCYERRLKANPMLAGNMSLSVKVGSGGGVEGVQVGGTLRDRDVFSCVRGVAMQMRFPAVTGGTCAVVRVPYRFEADR